MPPNPERRAQLLDTAIEILGDVGIGGLTHRAVDERAGEPPGTTSNYFRTRLALLEATTGRVADLVWQYVGVLQEGLVRQGGPLTRETVAALMTRMVIDAHADPVQRRTQLARFELFNEGIRRPELRPFLREIGEIARMLNGLAYSNMTFIEGGPGAKDPAGLIDRLLTAVLG
jgi:DNA-binding transcriptional regulator YbjK